jgi:hypothetical protein
VAAVTCDVGRAEFSIWHLPRHTSGSHRVLVRCENNFESSPVSLYIAHRHMFKSTCKISFWMCIPLFNNPVHKSTCITSVTGMSLVIFVLLYKVPQNCWNLFSFILVSLAVLVYTVYVKSIIP